MKNYRLFINNEWVDGEETRPVKSPYDQKSFAEVAFAGERQVEAALDSATQAMQAGRRIPTHVRAKWLERMRDGIAERYDDMIETISEEAGKPVSVAKVEVDRGINTFDLASKLAMTHEDESYPLDVIKYGERRECFVKRFPIGPVLAITPFNWPLNLGGHKVAPALAVGCPVVMRPASQTPCTSMLLAEIAQQAEVAPGFYNVVPCPSKLASKMATDDRIKMVSFTGSPEVGWSLKEKASNKRVALELGSNSACVLEPETDLDFAVPRLATGTFAYAGQVCISVQRIYVHEQIRETFDTRMLDHLASSLHTGDPRDEKVTCGPIIDKDATDRIMNWIEEAKKGGGRILCGGERLSDNMIAPTLMDNVSSDAKLSCQEVFGPVAVIETYHDFDDVLARVNDSRYGINAGVFTNDINKAWRAFETLEVGCVVINDSPHFRIDRMPYGGVKESGFGREGVQYTMEEMQEIKAMIVNLGIAD